MKKYCTMLACLSVAGMLNAGDYVFDFGPKDGKKAVEGITLVEVKDIYSAEKKSGWEKPLRAVAFTRELDAGVDEQTRDGICSAEGAKENPAANDMTFVADVPDGFYQMEVAVGDSAKGECRQNICVDVNGLTMIPEPGVGGWGQVVKKSFPAEVKDGKLKVRFYCSPIKNDLSRLSLLSLALKQLTAEADIKKAKEELLKVTVPVKEKAE
jgi:hypothetical protein